jgi:hypothetical protein
MRNIEKRIERLEQKARIADTEKKPLIIAIKTGIDFACPGYYELIRRAETEGRVFFHEGRQHIVIQKAANCGKGCTRCRKELD